MHGSREDGKDQRVSMRAMEPVQLLVRAHDLDPEALVEGLDLDAERLMSSSSGRIDWYTFAEVMNRVERQVGLEPMREIGRRLPDMPGTLSAIASSAALVASPSRLYSLAPRLGLATLFPMIEGRYESLSPTRSRIVASLPPNYLPSVGFWAVSAGNFEVLPLMVGHQAATVEMETDGISATYTITHPASRTLWSRLRMMWRALFRANDMVEELTSRNEELARQLTQAAAAQERAERAIATQDALLTAVSHELRTPLGQVIGLVGLCQNDPSLSAEVRGNLELARRAAGRLRRTVDELVQVAALGDAAAEPVPEVVDAGALVTMVLQSYRGREDVQLHEEVPVIGSWYVAAPQGWLMTVVRELVSNAFKFTSEGSVRVELRAGAGRQDGHVTLKLLVQDTGIGIAPSDQARIFEPFVQVDSGRSRQREGMGLGLTLVRSLVQRLGGTVTLTSMPGFGTTVLVELDLVEAEPGSEADSYPPEDVSLVAALEPIPTPTPSEPSESPRLLVVDDHPLNRMLLTKLGERIGYDVHAVEGGEQALNELSERPYDLVFMDVQMPGMDGLEATRRIRSHDRLSWLPVVAVTAQVAPGDEARCPEAGMDTYVPKPVDVEALQCAIDGALAAGRERRGEDARPALLQR